MTPNRIVHFSAALCTLALLAACDDSPENTQAPAPNVPTAPQAKSNKAPAPLTPPPAPSSQLAPLAPPTSAFYVGGKTPETSLIPGNKPDIGGIRIGEPLNPSLITKLNPAYKIQKYTSSTGRESGIDAKTEHDRLTVMWNDAGLVWHVSRSIKLEEGERFMFDTFKSSLLDKYGQPSYATRAPLQVYDEILLWSYDREGNLFHGSDASSLCEWNNGSRPSSFEPNCGYKIQAGADSDNRIQGAVERYSIAITYAKPIFDELVFKDKEEKLAIQRKFEEDTRRVQQNRPQL
ncbi:hypothetical protein AGMMS49960_21510 [Betaproteobacteria bacterium]|nr:hypothetical protein AGMMS49960_21510 [Betaproteobacteria bacterium]GHU22271.1 hypothetical protein AGMMS50243_21550 [Betaproteobacteria bacterium]